MEHIIDQVYKLRRNFVVIGLTGRIGSGCSMLANWMRWDHKKFVETINLISDNNEIYNNECRKYLITKKYWRLIGSHLR